MKIVTEVDLEPPIYLGLHQVVGDIQLHLSCWLGVPTLREECLEVFFIDGPMDNIMCPLNWLLA